MSLPSWAQRLPMDLIKAEADERELDYRLVAAIIQQESGGEQWTTRFEPLQKNNVTSDYWATATRLRITSLSEQMLQCTSFGLGQIMGNIARRLGYEDHLTRLCDAEINIHYECLLLGQLFKRFKILQDVIASYNMGSPRKKNGILLNQVNYVDPVLHLMQQLNNS